LLVWLRFDAVLWRALHALVGRKFGLVGLLGRRHLMIILADAAVRLRLRVSAALVKRLRDS